MIYLLIVMLTEKLFVLLEPGREVDLLRVHRENDLLEIGLMDSDKTFGKQLSAIVRNHTRIK